MRSWGLILALLPVVAGAQDVRKDIVYAQVGNRTLKLDAYLPSVKKAPVVVLLHGGGFTGGDKGGNTGALAEFLRRKGFACFDVQYRLQRDLGANASLTSAIKAATEDAGRALEWITLNAAKYDLDPGRIAIGGSSAGAITSLLAAYGPDRSKVKVKAVIDLWGGMYGWIGSMKKGDPPLMIIHGMNDRTVPYSEAEALIRQAKAVGVRSTVISVPNAGHTLNLSTVVRGESLQDAIATFLLRELK